MPCKADHKLKRCVVLHHLHRLLPTHHQLTSYDVKQSKSGVTTTPQYVTPKAASLPSAGRSYQKLHDGAPNNPIWTSGRGLRAVASGEASASRERVRSHLRDGGIWNDHALVVGHVACTDAYPRHRPDRLSIVPCFLRQVRVHPQLFSRTEVWAQQAGASRCYAFHFLPFRRPDRKRMHWQLVTPHPHQRQRRKAGMAWNGRQPQQRRAPRRCAGSWCTTCIVAWVKSVFTRQSIARSHLQRGRWVSCSLSCTAPTRTLFPF